MTITVGVAKTEAKIKSARDYFNPKNLKTVKKCNDLYKRANAYYKRKDYPKAAETYEKFIELNVFDFDSFMELGISYFKLSKLNDSIRKLKKAKELRDSTSVNSKLAEIFLKKAANATIKLRRKNWEEAARYLDSIEVEGEYAEEIQNLRKLMSKVKRA